MDNSTKGIWLAIGIIVTLALAIIGVSFYTKSANTMKTADTNMNDLTTTISQAKYSEYDNTTVSGSQALNAIRLYASSTFSVVVTTKAGNSTSYSSPTQYNVINTSDTSYIEPTGQFKATVLKTANGTVNSIVLNQL